MTPTKTRPHKTMLAEWAEFLSLSLSLLPDRSRFQKQPLSAAFVDLRKAYDSVQHPLLWTSLQRKGVHGKMLAAIQSLYSGGAMSMKICGRAGATGMAQVGVRQGGGGVPLP